MITLCLLLFSTYLSGGIFARYTTSGSASDSARVAMFRTPTIVFADQDGIVLDTYNANGGDNATTVSSKDFTVSMTTEVDAKYDVVVTCSTPVPTYVTMDVDGIAPTVSRNVYTFKDAGSFNAGATSSNSHTLTFKAGIGYHEEPANIGNVSVKVIVTQID